MAQRLDVYKCEKCGIIVETLDGGGGVLVCCGAPMKLFAENTVDASKEKHVPVIERVEGGIKIKIGSVPHPMEAKHFIQWIEIIADGRACRQYLKPGDPPETVFRIQPATLSARELCNLHGLWSAKQE